MEAALQIGTPMVATGWGLLREGGTLAKVLQEVRGGWAGGRVSGVSGVGRADGGGAGAWRQMQVAPVCGSRGRGQDAAATGRAICRAPLLLLLSADMGP